MKAAGSGGRRRALKEGVVEQQGGGGVDGRGLGPWGVVCDAKRGDRFRALFALLADDLGTDPRRADAARDGQSEDGARQEQQRE